MKFANVKPLRQEYEYDFFNHGVTKSMIESFLLCPEQCRLAYVVGLEPIKMPEKFLFGNIVHYAMEKYYEEKKRVADLGNFCDSYFNTHCVSDSDSLDEIESKQMILESAKATVNAYISYNFMGDEFQWPDTTEEVFHQPLKFHAKLPPANLNGMFDMRFQSVHRLVDHKTKSRIDMEKDITKYPIDTQLNLYSLVYLLQYGTAPEFTYNIFRVPQDRPKKNFYEHLFQKMLEKPDYYFHREVYKTNADELIKWQKEILNPILTRMYVWAKGNYEYPGYYNPVALDTMYGLSHWFRPLVYGDFTGFQNKHYPFVELTKDEI